MKYTNKLRNMARVLSEMGTDMLPASVGCAFIGVSEVENAKCLTDLCAQEPLAARNMQFFTLKVPTSVVLIVHCCTIPSSLPLRT